VAWLASDRSTFVNGIDIVVDGGLIGGRMYAQHQEGLKQMKARPMPFPKTPALTTDCVVVDARGRVLLVKRKHPPFKGHYALPGGFVDVGETLEEACRRELAEEAGIEVGRLTLLGVYCDPKRDPRGHTCSIAFLARVGRATPTAGDDAAAAEWVESWSQLDLAFDHAKILADARRALRKAR
jgi:8-oxo-dGTP diphosphatase